MKWALNCLEQPSFYRGKNLSTEKISDLTSQHVSNKVPNLLRTIYEVKVFEQILTLEESCFIYN